MDRVLHLMVNRAIIAQKGGLNGTYIQKHGN